MIQPFKRVTLDLVNGDVERFGPEVYEDLEIVTDDNGIGIYHSGGLIYFPDHRTHKVEFAYE